MENDIANNAYLSSPIKDFVVMLSFICIKIHRK